MDVRESGTPMEYQKIKNVLRNATLAAMIFEWRSLWDFPQLRPYTRQFQSALNVVVRLHHKDPAPIGRYPNRSVSSSHSPANQRTIAYPRAIL